MRFSIWLLATCGLAAAESGQDGWLRWTPEAGETAVKHAINSTSLNVPLRIVALNDSKASPVYTAGVEIQNAMLGLFNKKIPVSHTVPNATRSVIVGTVAEYLKVYRNASKVPRLLHDGFWISTGTSNRSAIILGKTERGALYGAYEYLSLLARGNFSKVAYASNPSAPIRWVNQWDNLDGSIERGYAGPSIFFKDGFVVEDLTRVAEYARLLSSIRVNGLVINNVNANASLLSAKNVEGLGKIADIMRPFGVQLGISLNFASPTAPGIGNLTTFDPLSSSVVSWWTALPGDSIQGFQTWRAISSKPIQKANQDH